MSVAVPLPEMAPSVSPLATLVATLKVPALWVKVTVTVVESLSAI